jgi:DNA mismatch endonuclease (patch repair protein)
MTSEATRHVMQANKSKDTKPELTVRAALRERGYPGYRLHWSKAPGHPDICFPGRKVAIFVNGCFWHRCPHCALPAPKTNVEFWQAKFRRNRERDARDNALLVAAGWTVVVVWECRLAPERLENTMDEVVRELERADNGTQVAHVIEAGSAQPWHLRLARERLASQRPGFALRRRRA